MNFKDVDELELSYGSTKKILKIPKDRYKFVKPRVLNGVSGSEPIKIALKKALDNPFRSPKLENLIKNKRVTYLIDDSTRAEPHREFLEVSFPLLKRAKFLTIIIATGSHATYSKGNLEIIELIKRVAKKESMNNYEIVINDAFEKNSFDQIGHTSAGTILEVNKKALDCDVFFVTSDMKSHYFAGYSNAIKDFVPGICSYKTIEMNHSMALDSKSTFNRHPFHPDPKKRDNPLANDMWEATKLIQDFKNRTQIFILSTIVFDGQLAWCNAGDIEEVTRQGIEKLDELASFYLKPSKYMIVSPGAYPEDLSLYIAFRGLELTKEAVKENGEILFFAECLEGIAHNKDAEKSFYRYLIDDLEDMKKKIKENYILYTHIAFKFAELLKRTKVIHMVTSLDKNSVESVHMKKIEDYQTLIDDWIENSDEIINVIDNSNKIAIFSK